MKENRENSMLSVRQLVPVLYENLWELVRLNAWFLLCCLPVVTIPAACTAMAQIAQRLVRDALFDLRADFLKSFRANLLRAFPVGLAVFGCAALSLFVVPFYRDAAAIHPVFYLPLGLTAGISAFLLTAGFYAFPMLAAVELPVRQILRNSLRLAVVRLPQNLAALLMIGAIWLLVVACLPVSLLLVFTFACSLTAVIAVYNGWCGILDYVLKTPE